MKKIEADGLDRASDSPQDEFSDSERRARRRLLKIGIYGVPMVIGTVALTAGGCAPGTCMPATCDPVTPGMCTPDPG